MAVSDENKALALLVAQSLGGTPHVIRHVNEAKTGLVDILHCVDAPTSGIVSYCTIGVSDFPLRHQAQDVPVRVELLGIAGASKTQFSAMLAHAAFYIMKSRWWVRSGAILKNSVDSFPWLSRELKHLFFLPPLYWDDALMPTELGDKRVSWLLTMPISDSEREYAMREGGDKLQQILEHSQVDLTDLDRAPVV